MNRGTRSTIGVLAVATLFLPAAATLGTAEHVVRADTSALTISAFEETVGTTTIELGTTAATATSAPLATAEVTAAKILGTGVGGTPTASSEGARDSDPATGDGCATAGALPGLTLSVLCMTATAQAATPGAAQQQDAAAKLGLASLDIDGSFLAALLTSSLDELLADVLTLAGDDLYAESIEVLAAACDEVLATVTDPDVVKAIPNGVKDLIELIPVDTTAASDVVDLVADPSCSALLNLSLGTVTAPILDLTPIADALDGIDLLQLTLGDMTSTIDGVDTTLNGDAQQTFVAISGPSLDFLDDLLVGIVQGVINGIVTELEAIAGITLISDLDIPGQLSTTLDLVPLLDDSSPLLTGLISGGSTSADLGLAKATTSAGGVAPSAVLSIAPGVLGLLGEPADPIALTAGQSQTIADGTPLKSTINVGTLVVDENALDDETGLPGSRATTSVTKVTLLSGVQGGLVIDVGSSNAEAFAAVLVKPEIEPKVLGEELAQTGGGTALAAVIGLGLFAALRRRRRD